MATKTKTTKEQNINNKLFNLQQDIGKIPKTSDNPFYKSKYVNIDDVLDKLYPLLAKYKLLLHQPINIDFETGIQYVETFLECEQTNQRSTFARMKLVDEKDPQRLGSQITYYRRYTLISLLGLQTGDDDDGELADTRQPLNIDSPNFQQVRDYIQKGGDMQEVKKKFKITNVTEKQLRS